MLDYDIVILGGGLAGRDAALNACRMQARVALIEPEATTSDFRGFINFSNILHPVRQNFKQIQQAPQWGIPVNLEGISGSGQSSIQWSQTRQWANSVEFNLGENLTLTQLASAGVDVIIGEGEFVQEPRLAFQVNGRTLRSRTYLLATPTQAKVPEIEGLTATGYLTPETLPHLTLLPERLAILGADPIGIELAQTFAQLGTEVTIIVKHSQILEKEDPEAAYWVQAQLEAEGIRILTQTTVSQVKTIQGKKWLQAGNEAIEVDEILLTAGQYPNLQSLNLAALGVKFRGSYLRLNDQLQTTNPRIYACGEVAGGYPFLHLAIYEARIALKNALYLPIYSVNYQGIPWAIFTDPQLARVGFTENQAKRRYPNQIFVERQELKSVFQAQISGETTGFCKLIAHRNGKILGASVVAAQASELIHLIAFAIRQGLKVDAIADLQTILPTYSQLTHWTAAEWLYQRRRQNTLFFDGIENLFHWRRYWSS